VSDNHDAEPDLESKATEVWVEVRATIYKDGRVEYRLPDALEADIVGRGLIDGLRYQFDCAIARAQMQRTMDAAHVERITRDLRMPPHLRIPRSER